MELESGLEDIWVDEKARERRHIEEGAAADRCNAIWETMLWSVVCRELYRESYKCLGLSRSMPRGQNCPSQPSVGIKVSASLLLFSIT